MPKAQMRFPVDIQLIFDTPSGMPDIVFYSVSAKATRWQNRLVDEAGEKGGWGSRGPCVGPFRRMYMTIKG
jgi:hypothetical protein